MRKFLAVAAVVSCAVLLAVSSVPAMDFEGVQIHGSTDLTYIDWEADGYRGGKAFLDNYETYISFSGNVGEKLSYWLEPRYEHGGDGIEIRQTYLNWHAGGEAFGLRMGKFYMPVGIYRHYYYNSLRNFVSYAVPMRVIQVAPWSETGIAAFGDVALGGSGLSLQYELGVFNGLGDEVFDEERAKPRDARQNRDNNDAKTIGGRVGLNHEMAQVGFSYNTGKYDEAEDFNLDLIGFDVRAAMGPVAVRGEWIKSTTESPMGDIETDGWYAQAVYTVLRDMAGVKYVDLAARYATIDPGQSLRDRYTLAADQQSNQLSLAINVSPVDNLLFKFEWMTIDDDDPDLDNDGIFGQAVLFF